MASSRLEKIGTIYSRRQGNERLIRSLSSMLTQLEADGVALKENEQRLMHITSVQMKTVQQTATVHAQRLQALKDIHCSYVKQCEMVEATHREQCESLLDEMASDARNMQQKLLTESRKTGLDTLRKTMIVEGLLTRGGMKAADRPMWFDVYKAFPPAVEPKYARPKPMDVPIKSIFYEEDKQRAKFHAAGHGLGAVNMLTQSGETHTKRLLRQYETLQSQESQKINFWKKVLLQQRRKEETTKRGLIKSSSKKHLHLRNRQRNHWT